MRFIKIKPYIWWYILPMLFFTTCLEPEPVELPFFTVKTQAIENSSSRLLGKVVLKGEIQGIEANEQLDQYGFLFSQNLSFVNDPSNIDQRFYYHDGALNNSGSSFLFSDTATIKQGINYYARAYVQKGERLVFGVIQTYQVNLDFDIRFLDRKNDLLIFESKIKGLGDSLQITKFGVLIAETAEGLSFTNPLNSDQYNIQEDNTPVTDSLKVAFNKTYYFQLYAIGADICLGPIDSFRVTDGWKLLDPIPVQLFNAVAISNGAEAYLIGGCSFPGSEDCPPALINDKYFSFSADEDGMDTWDAGTASPDARISEAIGVFFQNHFLVGFGKSGSSTINRIANPINNQIFNACQGQTYEFISNAVSFVIDDAIYYGTGNIDNENSNSFWQLKLTEDNCMEIQAMPPLPIRSNNQNNITNAGREGAISIKVKDSFYVGFGRKGADPLNDIYQFHSPRGNDTAYWEFIDFADAPGSREEAMSFTIDGRAYIGFGVDISRDVFLNDLWEFCPKEEDEVWKKREPLPARGRRSGFSFALNGFGYIGGGKYQELSLNGAEPKLLRDTWEYTPITEE